MTVTLKTLDRTFVTNPDNWQAHSPHFGALFSGKWADQQSDGSYYIETDSLVFEHILRYLRTGVLPVFFDTAKGHDFALYHSILGEAKYFGFDRLCRWLEEKKYLEAVKIIHLAGMTEKAPAGYTTTVSDPKGHTLWRQYPNFVQTETSGDVEISLQPAIQRGSTFLCPTGRHGKDDGSCWKHCIQSAADGGGWRYEDKVHWTIVRKAIECDFRLCANAYLDA